MTRKIRMAYQRYSSCGGCQLTLLNVERELPQLANFCEVVDFPLVSSDNERDSSLDVALAEGSITTPEELDRLLDLRRRAKFLIAVGACALNGGVNVLAKDRDVLLEEVYGVRLDQRSFSPQPLDHFVRIDGRIHGCPPEGSDYLRLLGSLQQGGFPGDCSVPVCMECRLRENRCLLIDGEQPCLGAVTRGGCQARCPSFGVVCEGCRGAVPEANFPEQVKLLQQIGLSGKEIRGRLERFFRRSDEDS